VKLDLQHEEDLLVSARAFMIQHRDTSPSQFWRWIQVLQALNRYPEVLAISEFSLIPQSSLALWEHNITVHPIQVGRQPHVALLPPGRRPYYCLQTAAVARTAVQPGIDACASDPLLYATIATGNTSAYPIAVEDQRRLFGVALPVYRSPTAPANPTARRDAFSDWVGVVIVAKVLLEQALQDHPNMSIVLHRGSGPALAFTAGRPPAGAHTLTIDLHDGTTVEVFGSVTSAGIFANTTATIMLLAGVALSVLGGLLLYVLATGRSRALLLVEEKTEELSFQASHDGLTSLPNRLLLLERTTRALARVGRKNPAAALFIDIDGFKGINDSFGHAAGDELLRVIASRLDAVIRESDTVARFGGDEFVILLESEDSSASPEVVAQRILDALSEPIDVGNDNYAAVTASIGIAAGARASAHELLHDADLALYAAKAAGKNCYMFYSEPIPSRA
jgi:diguanylate cyclase (GGDEF)-like protein